MTTTPLYLISPDIDETILAALQQVLTDELQAGVAPGDPLLMRTIKISPLQDDPTLTAPYVVFSSNYEKGIEAVTSSQWEKQYGDTEIGGPTTFVYHYSATCGTPIVTTREKCAAQIGNLATRITEVLMRHYDLSNILATGLLVSADYTKQIERANRKLVDLIKRRLKGGEQTWFGEATIEWHYPVSWDIE